MVDVCLIFLLKIDCLGDDTVVTGTAELCVLV